MDDKIINENIGTLSLGERMVLVARLAAIRHIELALAAKEVRPDPELATQPAQAPQQRRVA